MPTVSFLADAALFDMDGTLTDSIAAVEAAWSKVANDIGADPKVVIAATHGRRASDNLAAFKPDLLSHEIPDAVVEFEESILYFADAHRRRTMSTPNGRNRSDEGSLSSDSDSSGIVTPAHIMASLNTATQRPFSTVYLEQALLSSALNGSAIAEDDESLSAVNAGVFLEALEPWQVEASKMDRSVRILPGVRRMLDSIPEGRYAVATSGAKTYAFGCMTRVGIVPPSVTITADDARLKAGKPKPDPFILAAECLGYDSRRCVVFEDSPAGICAGVAAGAIVIAVCTSHPREKIAQCGAHFIVENMEKVDCRSIKRDGHEYLEFTVDITEGEDIRPFQKWSGTFSQST